MKKTSLYIASLIAGAVAFQSCSDDWVTPPLDVPVFPAGTEANITVADLKTQYWQDQDSYGTTVGKTAEGDSAIILGTVASSTNSGNIYKTLVVQDATGAITIGIDDSSVGETYPMGAAIAVNITGMTIGRYNGLMQLGTTSGSGVDRIALAEFQPRAALDIMAGKLDTTVVTLPELLQAARTTEGKIKWQSRLIRINDIHFVEAGQDFSNGGNTSRHIADAEGNRIICYNSSYADFAYEKMPRGTGDVVGILSCYRNDWQLLLIDAASCIDFDGQGGGDEPAPDVEPAGEGTQASPYNVAKALQVIAAGPSEDKVYVKAKILEVKEVSTSFGNATYSLTDNGSNSLDVYRGYWLNGDKFTSADQLQPGAEVIVYGVLVNYKGNTPQFTQGSQVYSYNGQTGGGDTPTPGPEGNTVYSSLSDTAAELPEGWTFDNIELGGLEYVWSWKTYNDKGYLNGSAYKDGAVASDAYAVSPVIDLTGATKCALTFDHAAKFQTTLREMCGVAIRAEGATEWTALTIPTWPEAGSWTFVNAGSIDISAFDGKKVQVAFRYKSSVAGADTWEIKNLKLTATK